MSDIFNPDPNKIKQDIAKGFEETSKIRESTADVISKSSEQIRAANQAQARNIENFSGKAQVQFDRMSEALDNMSRIESLPEGITDIIGFFDRDFNKGVQLNKMQRAEFELNRINQLQKNANITAQLTASSAAQEAQTALQLFEFTREGFLDTIAAAESGFRIEEGVQQRDLRAAENLSVEQLREFAADPSKAPTNLRDKPGLIQSVMLSKVSQELGVSAQQLSIDLNREVLENQRKENVMRKFDIPQLKTMLDTNNFPGGLTIADVQDELNRRVGAEQSLKSAAIANQQGELELAFTHKQTALGQMTVKELETGLSNATTANGRIELQGVEFTATELRTELLRKQQIEKQQRDISLGQIAAQAATSGTINQIGSTASGLSGATNPGTPFNPETPFENLPPQLQSEMQGLQAQLDAMSKLQEAGVDTITKQVEILNTMNEKMTTAKESFIKAQPAETQNGYRQYIDNGGFIEDAKAASDYLTASSSPFALNYDPVMAKPFEQFANSLNDLASQQIQSIGTADISDEGTGTLEIRKRKELESGQLVNQALKESKAGTMLSQMLMQKLMADTIVNLQGGNKDSIWSGIVDPETRRFDERVFSTEGTFEFNKLAQLLAAKTVAFRDAGVIPPGQSMIGLMVDEARSLSGALKNIGANDPTAAAFIKSAYNNNPQLAVNSLLMRFKDQEQPALAAVLEQKRLLEEEGKALARDAAEMQQGTERNVFESALSGFSSLSMGPSRVRREFKTDRPPQPTDFELEIRNILGQPEANRGGTP